MYAPIGANMFVRKSMFEKHGYFNTQLGQINSEVNIGTEDSEIMFRFKGGGEAILYYPRALAYHPVLTDRMEKAYFRKWWWGNGRGQGPMVRLPGERGPLPERAKVSLQALYHRLRALDGLFPLPEGVQAVLPGDEGSLYTGHDV